MSQNRQITDVCLLPKYFGHKFCSGSTDTITPDSSIVLTCYLESLLYWIFSNPGGGGTVCPPPPKDNAHFSSPSSLEQNSRI